MDYLMNMQRILTKSMCDPFTLVVPLATGLIEPPGDPWDSHFSPPVPCYISPVGVFR